MDTRKIAREYRLSSWAQFTHERSESGLSVREFCRSRGIHENTYYHWQRRLREAAVQELQITESKQLAVPSGWTAVVEPEPPSPSATLTVEVGGCRVAVSAETDLELLAKVCKVLVSLC